MAAWSGDAKGITIANSSPPKRATTSETRTAPSEPFAHGYQDLVAGGVPKAVIDGFERVQVHQQDGRALLGWFRTSSAGGLQCGPEGFNECGPVGQARQGVLHGHLLHFQVGLVQELGPDLYPLFEFLVDDLQVLGQQVGAHDDGIEFVPGGGDLNAGVEVAGSEPDNAFEQLGKPGVVVGKHRQSSFPLS
ncbi:hypothetical protein QF050_000548 [Arthrobacter sp. SLBN-112]|nr:hypothetical protein [Arthrobacter sp. SLBN-112]